MLEQVVQLFYRGVKWGWADDPPLMQQSPEP